MLKWESIVKFKRDICCCCFPHFVPVRGAAFTIIDGEVSWGDVGNFAQSVFTTHRGINEPNAVRFIVAKSLIAGHDAPQSGMGDGFLVVDGVIKFLMVMEQTADDTARFAATVDSAKVFHERAAIKRHFFISFWPFLLMSWTGLCFVDFSIRRPRSVIFKIRVGESLVPMEVSTHGSYHDGANSSCGNQKSFGRGEPKTIISRNTSPINSSPRGSDSQSALKMEQVELAIFTKVISAKEQAETKFVNQIRVVPANVFHEASVGNDAANGKMKDRIRVMGLACANRMP